MQNHSITISQLKKMAINHIPSFVVADSQGRYVYANNGWEHLTGYKFSEVIGKKITDIMPDSKIDEVIKTGKAIYAYQLKDTENNTTFNNCIPLEINGKIVGAVIISIFTNLSDALTFTNEMQKLKEEVNYYKENLRKLQGAKKGIDDIIGTCPATLNLKKQIIAAARTNSTVLIEGETGTGKELVANAIHDLSFRRECPFIKINCAAIPPELFESELFGYEKGSFTGANAKGKQGLFEAANKGSLFLDEINQLAYFMQPKLLRTLQEKEIRRVGGNRSIPVNVRIIAATNKSLEKLVEENLFREDLYYRLNVVTIRIPPLRERIEDIPELVESIRKKLNYELGTHVDGISQDAEQQLMSYNWPGNIRELQNVMERAMNTQLNGVLTLETFKPYFELKGMHYPAKKEQTIQPLINEQPSTNKDIHSLSDARQEAEKNLILTTLLNNKYNKTKTAKELHISRSALYQKIQHYGIDL